MSAQYLGCIVLKSWSSQVVLVVNTPPATAGDMRDKGSIPGSGRFPGGGRGNPLQSSCLETPMERGAWRATVHGVKESDTTEQLSTGVRARWGLGDPVLRNLKSWSWRQAEQGWHFPHFHR